MADYKSYLAANILTEDETVTYRLLSRALKVHVNVAKEMLYDFHHQQNAKKPGAVHATYLISGTKRIDQTPPSNGHTKKDGEDDYMQSSPFISSSMPQPQEDTGEISVLSITLTREEDLEKIRSEYEEITSIHIYSLEPSSPKDLQTLSDVTRQIQELCANDDPLEISSNYGTITNKNVKRRALTRPPPHPAVAAVSAKAQLAKPKPADTKEVPKSSTSKVKEEGKPSTAKDFFGKGKEKTKPAAAAASNPPSTESTPNPPALKRDSSSIFKAFAKTQPKLKREGTDSSAAASPALSPAEDSPMKDVSDDEEETYVPPVPSKEIVDKDRKSRKDREALLRKMMEDDDEDEDVATPDAEEEPKVEEDKPVKEESVEPKEDVTTDGGRRRGRRRVMKKKTVKDEEGYLVTKEEAVWESFSEDEPVASKAKIQVASTTAKSKKPAGKGQGSIMSFFGKK